MKTKDIPVIAKELTAKMAVDGFSQETVEVTRWITGLFQKYCDDNGYDEAEIPVAVEFFKERFCLDYYAQLLSVQTVIRKPLLNLFEFEESGNYLHFHPKSRNTTTPVEFKDVFMAYRDNVNQRSLAYTTKSRKIWEFSRHLEYLACHGIKKTKDIEMHHVFDYFSELNKKYSHQTLASTAAVIREIYDWMYDRGDISFSGKAALPYIRRDIRDKVLSYYSKEEINQLLSCIDTETAYGKFTYAVICIIAHLGLRAGDVIRLRFSDIDWNKNQLHIIQHKTGIPLSLPLVDEVKFPLLDYIKNARPESVDADYIFISINAPHRKYKVTGTIHRVITQSMEIAGIQYEGRHHGPHALRHSLATGLMNDNVPISAIANILGHGTTQATEMYLTVDETHSKELTLEVPHEC